jgi:alcohol dehydrogenase
VEGIRLVKESLARAVRDGHDIEARAHMMSAALMGATAFQKALGAIHALSHPVGALHDTHHGMTNAVFMPYVLVFNRPAIEEKVARLASYLGLSARFDAFLRFILDLREATGVPHSLQGLGVDASQLDRIAAMAPQDPTAGGNPVPLDERSARALFITALEGKL